MFSIPFLKTALLETGAAVLPAFATTKAGRAT
jgi:hypothetical protein